VAIAAPPSVRRACSSANRSSTGAAAALIMPTIITAHITNVKKRSAAPHDASILIPIFAINASVSAEEDI
jgi:hypothetical protein